MKRTIRITGAGIIAVIAAVLSGCTSAGPFVTNISADGKGNIIVEKNMVHMNAFMGTVSAGKSPTTQVIRVLPEPDQKQK